MPLLGTGCNGFLTIKCSIFFSLSSLISLNAWSYLRIAVYITFANAIIFKLGAWSDFMHYMIRFSMISSHGLIRVYHRNIILVLRIGYRSSFTHCGHFFRTTLFWVWFVLRHPERVVRAPSPWTSGSCSVTLREWFVLRHTERVVRAPSPWASGSCSVTLSEWFVFSHPEQVVCARSPRVSGSCSVTLKEWFVLRHPERVVRALSPWVSGSCSVLLSELWNNTRFPSRLPY